MYNIFCFHVQVNGRMSNFAVNCCIFITIFSVAHYDWLVGNCWVHEYSYLLYFVNIGPIFIKNAAHEKLRKMLAALNFLFE